MLDFCMSQIDEEIIESYADVCVGMLTIFDKCGLSQKLCMLCVNCIILCIYYHQDCNTFVEYFKLFKKLDTN